MSAIGTKARPKTAQKSELRTASVASKSTIKLGGLKRGAAVLMMERARV